MIATTIEQSKELVRLGLGPATSDMWWIDDQLVAKSDKFDFPSNDEETTVHCAWSLSALLEVMCYCHNVDVEFRKDKNLGWICKWTFYDFDNKKRLDLSKCGETKIEAAFEIVVTLFVQGLIKEGGEQ